MTFWEIYILLADRYPFGQIDRCFKIAFKFKLFSNFGRKLKITWNLNKYDAAIIIRGDEIEFNFTTLLKNL